MQVTSWFLHYNIIMNVHVVVPVSECTRWLERVHTLEAPASALASALKCTAARGVVLHWCAWLCTRVHQPVHWGWSCTGVLGCALECTSQCTGRLLTYALSLADKLVVHASAHW